MNAAASRERWLPQAAGSGMAEPLAKFGHADLLAVGHGVEPARGLLFSLTAVLAEADQVGGQTLPLFFGEAGDALLQIEKSRRGHAQHVSRGPEAVKAGFDSLWVRYPVLLASRMLRICRGPCSGPGSARVPRAILGVSPRQGGKCHLLYDTFGSGGGTPTLAPETGALPGPQRKRGLNGLDQMLRDLPR